MWDKNQRARKQKNEKAETMKIRELGSDVIIKDQPTESPVPLHVRQPRWVPEPFGKWITVDLQFGDLQNSREGQ